MAGPPPGRAPPRRPRWPSPASSSRACASTPTGCARTSTPSAATSSPSRRCSRSSGADRQAPRARADPPRRAGRPGGRASRWRRRSRPTRRSRRRCRALRAARPRTRSARRARRVDAVLGAAGGDDARRATPDGRGRAQAPASAAAPGYLGAEARVRSGPAPELVAAGYELELADAALLHRGFGLADMAHVLALDDDPRRRRARAAQRAARARRAGPRSTTRATATSPTCASARWSSGSGSAAGWLNAGRPRREAGRIAFRIALRDAAARPASRRCCGSPPR